MAQGSREKSGAAPGLGLKPAEAQLQLQRHASASPGDSPAERLIRTAALLSSDSLRRIPGMVAGL